MFLRGAAEATSASVSPQNMSRKNSVDGANNASNNGADTDGVQTTTRSLVRNATKMHLNQGSYL